MSINNVYTARKQQAIIYVCFYLSFISALSLADDFVYLNLHVLRPGDSKPKEINLTLWRDDVEHDVAKDVCRKEKCTSKELADLIQLLEAAKENLRLLTNVRFNVDDSEHNLALYEDDISFKWRVLAADICTLSKNDGTEACDVVYDQVRNMFLNAQIEQIHQLVKHKYDGNRNRNDIDFVTLNINKRISQLVNNFRDEERRLKLKLRAMQLELQNSMKQHEDETRKYNINSEQSQRVDEVLNLKNQHVLDIPREDASTLSIERFISEYVSQQKPVIIVGLENLLHWDSNTMKKLINVCGETIVTPKLRKNHVNNEGQWAGLSSSDKQPLRDLVHMIQVEGNQNIYLHDWSLAKDCPTFAKTIKIPKYFSSDAMQEMYKLMRETPSFKEAVSHFDMYANYWPSLFIGGNNTTSNAHADWCDTSAWMGIFEGRKEWVIVPPSHTKYLCKDPLHGNNFLADLLSEKPSNMNCPSANVALRYNGVVKKGEYLYIPAKSGHAVRNMDNLNIAVAFNFVDPTFSGVNLFGARARKMSVLAGTDSAFIFYNALSNVAELWKEKRHEFRSIEHWSKTSDHMAFEDFKLKVSSEVGTVEKA